MLPQEHIKDTLLHKKFVMEAGIKLIDYLFEQNRSQDAIALASRCSCHDDSKLGPSEMQEFLKLPNEGLNMKFADMPLADNISNLIRVHWANNRHHPEYFQDYHEMTELDVIEMVCDWYARSQQYGTNFKEFVKTRQKIRFKFDDDFFAVVWKYCELIDKEE